MGIDWEAPAGTPVYASAAGTVVRAETSTGGYGNVVTVRHVLPSHQVWFSLYAHMRDLPLVRVGATVSRRQQIGVVGSTGTSTENHLHFAVSSQERPSGYGRCGSTGTVDPIAFVNGN